MSLPCLRKNLSLNNPAGGLFRDLEATFLENFDSPLRLQIHYSIRGEIPASRF